MNRTQFKDAYGSASFQEQSGTGTLTFTAGVVVYGFSIANNGAAATRYQLVADGATVWDGQVVNGEVFTWNFAGRGLRAATTLTLTRTAGAESTSATIVCNTLNSA